MPRSTHERRSLLGESDLASTSGAGYVEPRGGGHGSSMGDFGNTNERRSNDSGSVLGLCRRLLRKRRVPPELLLLLTALIWGGYHPCMRVLLTETAEGTRSPTPSEINLARFSLVAVLFVAQAAVADSAVCWALSCSKQKRAGGTSRSTSPDGQSTGTGFGTTDGRSGETTTNDLESGTKIERVLSLDTWHVSGQTKADDRERGRGMAPDSQWQHFPQMPNTKRDSPKGLTSVVSQRTVLIGAACELAWWHFITIALQSTGVLYTSVTRAGFISTSTTMMVPVMEILYGQSVSTVTWTAAAVTMFGTALIVVSKSSEQATQPSVESTVSTVHTTHTHTTHGGHVEYEYADNTTTDDLFLGDFLTLLGSFTWAIFLLRLSKIAKSVPKFPLVVARSVCMVGFVFIWFILERVWVFTQGVEAQGVGDGILNDQFGPNVEGTAFQVRGVGGVEFTGDRSSLESSGNAQDDTPLGWLGTSKAVALILFMAIGPGWACSWWQTIAQAEVPAAKATVLMSTTPLWGALWAGLMMGETMSFFGWLGGFTIVGGTVLVALEGVTR